MNNNGFGDGSNNKAKVIIEQEEIEKLIKDYKRIKKYMKSSLFTIKNLDGTEKTVKELLENYGDESI